MRTKKSPFGGCTGRSCIEVLLVASVASVASPLGSKHMSAIQLKLKVDEKLTLLIFPVTQR